MDADGRIAAALLPPDIPRLIDGARGLCSDGSAG
jgi:hypothetical protein